ncbi:hypothetical protein NOF55_00120 [Rhizobiaceae bacterium BDR2-2]|uniref:DUF6985 domain-containing protein n=1 Tax=Ectorhizobium quercum TaxID=2965071 RepID=A0AAE3MV91_9HYPH|nr:hypothetical protein [Ectorhizobium quercum]MCX8995509.1 hypothetical protein [Ectorhizobium quercum]
MIQVPYFDNAEVELAEDIDDPDAATALQAFLSLTAADRLADSRHVFAYYRDFHEAVGGEDWLDERMGVPETPADIWKHVTPGPVLFENGRKDDTSWYVVMEAECRWEEEHGLMMVWRNGTALCKVGGYDGHPTNVNAYADPGLADVVYAATNKTYRTYLNGK